MKTNRHPGETPEKAAERCWAEGTDPALRLDETYERLAGLDEPTRLFAALFAVAPSAVQIYGADGHCVVTNKAFRDLFGSEPPPEYNVLEDEITEARGVSGCVRRAFAGETVETPAIWYDPRELRQVHVSSGRRVAVSATFFPLRDGNGRVAHVAFVFRDRTAEMAAREAADSGRAGAEAATRRLAFLAEASALLSASLEPERIAAELARIVVPAFADASSVHLVDDHGTLLRVADASSDPAMRESTVERRGAAVRVDSRHPVMDAFLGKSVHCHADYAEVVAARFEPEHPYAKLIRAMAPVSNIISPLLARGRALGTITLAMTRASGRRYAPDDVAVARELGQRAGLAIDNALAYAEARRARRAAEEQRDAAETARAALQESEERRRLAVDAAAIGTWEYDPVSGAIAWDSRCRTIFDFSPDATVDYEQFLACLHPADRTATRERVSAALEPQGAGWCQTEYRIVRSTGTERWVRATGKTVFDGGGRAQRMVGTVQDIDAQKNAAAELTREKQRAEEANRAKDEFLAMLGHELRNPLAPMLIALELMRRRSADVCVKERALIERQARHMVRLVDDLLDVSRVARGKVELKKARVEIAEVAARALEVVRPLLEERAHALTCRIPSTGLVVDGDAVRLGQVLANLLSNAAKYTERSGAVALEAAREGDDVVVRVRDTGAGIGPELLPHVFDRFVQGRQTLDRSAGGLGLGLAIVRSLVEMHGGCVTAYSEGAGRGSEFVVRLPLATSAEVTPIPDNPREPVGSCAPGPMRRVLVVDDNRDAAESLGEALRASGHSTCVAFDGAQALARVREFAPEIALLDIGLPVMDGYELARRLRERVQPLHLVAVTGYGLDADRQRSRDAGFDEHLVKPLELERVDSLIRRLGI